MLIRVEHLQVFHYLYFAAAIFSFSSLIITGMGTSFSYYFVAFCTIHMGFSWYITLIVKKNMKSYVKFNSIRFLGKHVVISVIIVFLTFLVWLVTFTGSGVVIWYGTPHGIELFNLITNTNYLVFFMTVIWYLLFKVNSVSDLLKIFNSKSLEKAKDTFISIRKEKGLGGLVSNDEVRKYIYGNDYRTDSFLVNLLEGKRTKDMLGYIRSTDIQMYSMSIESVKERLQKCKDSGAAPKEIKMIEKIIKDKEKKLEDFIRRTRNRAIG